MSTTKKLKLKGHNGNIVRKDNVFSSDEENDDDANQVVMMMVALPLAVDREAPGEGHEWRHQLLLVRPLHHAATATKMKKNDIILNPNSLLKT